MNTKIIRTLVKKEMLDVFRDKKTVIMMLVVPVILYPLIFVGVMQLMSFISSSMETQNYRIAVEAEDGDAFLHKLMEKADTSADPGSDAGASEAVEAASTGHFTEEKDKEEEKDREEESGRETDDSQELYEITVVDTASFTDYETALNEEIIDAYVFGQMQDGEMKYDVYYLSSSSNSAYAANIILEAFDNLKEEMTRQKI